MMRFEENSHCTLKERIALVSKEITDVYPEVPLEYAKTIALHDEPINKVADNDNKFMRYYYMMLFLKENMNMIYTLYVEIYKVAYNGLNDKKLFKLLEEIDKFISKNREDFPLISELYGH